MSTTTTREGRLQVVIAITLALVSIALAPTVITDKEYWRPFPFVFMSLCCLHLALGSDRARGFIAIYLALFGGIRVFAYVAVLATGGPASRNLVTMVGVAIGLVASGVLASSRPLREFLRVRYESRSGVHTALIRAAWVVFLVYAAVIVYLDLTTAT